MLTTIMPERIKLVVELPSKGPIILANEHQIHQILTNLITNAWEALGENEGKIRLAVKVVFRADIPLTHFFPLEWQPQDNLYASLEVADNGCGISDKNIDELFDPFFSTKFTGRGLGLPVVLGIARANQGVVTVESKVGQGSLFRVFFPVSAEAVTLPPEKSVKVVSSFSASV
jgi:signal transduction histidine kinase